MSNKSVRQATLNGIAEDIRRVSPGLVEITVEVALSNWEQFMSIGQYRTAAYWWTFVHQGIVNGKTK